MRQSAELCCITIAQCQRLIDSILLCIVKTLATTYMCGILAHYSIYKTIEDDKIKRAICLMHDRGPDSKGFKRFQECILGNSRLNIVDDNPNSNMPLRSMHNDVWITFNA